MLGEKSPRKVNSLQNVITDLASADKGENHLDHVSVITSRDLKYLLNIDGNFRKIYNLVEYLSYNIFESKYIESFILRLWEQSRAHLELIKSSQMVEAI